MAARQRGLRAQPVTVREGLMTGRHGAGAGAGSMERVAPGGVEGGGLTPMPGGVSSMDTLGATYANRIFDLGRRVEQFSWPGSTMVAWAAATAI
jgi:hypothetical protein